MVFHIVVIYVGCKWTLAATLPSHCGCVFCWHGDINIILDSGCMLVLVCPSLEWFWLHMIVWSFYFKSIVLSHHRWRHMRWKVSDFAEINPMSFRGGFKTHPQPHPLKLPSKKKTFGARIEFLRKDNQSARLRGKEVISVSAISATKGQFHYLLLFIIW